MHVCIDVCMYVPMHTCMHACMHACLIRLGHGCSGRTDGVWVDDIMVGTWMLWQNGWGLGGRYHGWDMDALAERMGSPGLGGRYHGWDMVLWQNGWGHRVWVDDTMVGTWLLSWASGGAEERRGGQTTGFDPSSSSSSRRRRRSRSM